jgi:hypothetical protein
MVQRLMPPPLHASQLQRVAGNLVGQELEGDDVLCEIVRPIFVREYFDEIGKSMTAEQLGES